MKYEVNGREFTDAESAAQEVIESIDESLYDDFLDEFGDVEICGLSYSASVAFKRVDPIAYNCGLSDWQDSLFCEAVDAVESLCFCGDDTDFYGVTIECTEDDEEEEEEEEEEENE